MYKQPFSSTLTLLYTLLLYSHVARRRRLLTVSIVLSFVAVALTFSVVLGDSMYRALYIDEERARQAYLRIPLLHNTMTGPCFIGSDEHIYPATGKWRAYATNKFQLECYLDKPSKAGIFFGLASLTLSTSLFIFLIITRFYLLEAKRKLHQVSFRLSYWCLVVSVFTLLNLVRV